MPPSTHHRPSASLSLFDRAGVSHLTGTSPGNDDDPSRPRAAAELRAQLRIRDAELEELKARLGEAERREEKEREKVRELKGKADRALSQQQVTRLEREFNSQEAILQGLQKDNEDKTIALETLRRRHKTLSDFCERHFGEDWEAVVYAAPSSSGGAGIGGGGGSGSTSADLPVASPGAVGGATGVNANMGVLGVGSPLVRILSSTSPSPVKRSSRPPLVSPLTPSISSVAAAMTIAEESEGDGEAQSANDWVPANETLAVVDESYAEETEVPTLEKGGAREGAAQHVLPDAHAAATIPAEQLVQHLVNLKLLVQGLERRLAGRQTLAEEGLKRAEEAERELEKMRAVWEARFGDKPPLRSSASSTSAANPLILA